MSDVVEVTEGDGTPIVARNAATPGSFVDAAGKVQLFEQGIVSGGVAYALPQTGTVTSVSDTASNTTLLAAGPTRRGYVIFNDSPYDLYVKHGATASTSSFTYKLGPGDAWEDSRYGGRVDGIWAANGSGAARITEYT